MVIDCMLYISDYSLLSSVSAYEAYIQENVRRRSMGFGRRASKKVSRSASFQASPEQLSQPLLLGGRSRVSEACDNTKRLLSDDLESSSLEPADDLPESEFQLVAHEVTLFVSTTTLYTCMVAWP